MIYLNNAATTWPKPESVYIEIDNFFRNMGVNPGRSQSAANMGAAHKIFETREKIADFLGISDSSHLIFNSGSTESLNTVIKGLLKENDHVITTALEHNAVIRPLEKLKKERNIEVTYLTINDKGEIDLKELEKSIKNNTKLIITTHASNVIGTVLDIKKIAEIAQKEDIFYLVDAAQSAGVIPIEAEEWGIDFLVIPGHKSLYGPPGIGALYINDPESINTYKEGGTGSNSLSKTQPSVMPDKFEAGTPNSPGIIGLGAGIDFIKEIGMKEIHSKEMKLLARLIQGLDSLAEVKIYGKREIVDRTAVLGFNIADFGANEIAFELENEYGIQLRSGLHCAPLLHKNMGTINQGMLRVSISYFNNQNEIEQLINAVAKIVEERF
ncbi:MAG: aminotransferase class V-fold PLP-dependent enzyme [Halanaerobium sp.]